MDPTVKCPKCRADRPLPEGEENRLCGACGEKLPAPVLYGAFQVVEKIGQGGMGTVYKAWDPALRRYVAIKTLLPRLAGEEESRLRFLREAQSIASITHLNITQIFAIDEKDGVPYFAMEYVDGQALSDLLAESERLTSLEAMEIITQAARGLQEAQKKGIVHRDIKPANLLITHDGTVKITDFGLAKEMKGDGGLTSVGMVMGSPNYMSPEQGRGEGLDHRSDIYSLGVTFFEAVTGRLPFDAPTPMGMILKHSREPAPSAKRFCPKVSYPLARVIQKMLAKKPEDRYQDYGILVRDLQMAERLEKKAATPAAPTPAVQPTRTPMGFPFFPLAVLGLVVLSGILFLSRQAGSEPAPPEVFPNFPVESPQEPYTGPTEPVRRLGNLLKPEPVPAPKKANLVFVENDREVLPDQGVRYFGIVQNRGEGTASRITVLIRSLDAEGNVLEEKQIPLSPPRLEPGGTGFYEFISANFEPPASIETEMHWERH